MNHTSDKVATTELIMYGVKMRIRRKLQPGQPSTKRPLEQGGEKLFCVRYCYGAENRRRLKTIELIMAEGPWQPIMHKKTVYKIVNI